MAGRRGRDTRSGRAAALVWPGGHGGGHTSGDGGRGGPRPAKAELSGARWAPRRPSDRAPGWGMTTQPQRLVAALDLGSTKAVAVIAEVTGDARDPGAKILGLGVERT